MLSAEAAGARDLPAGRPAVVPVPADAPRRRAGPHPRRPPRRRRAAARRARPGPPGRGSWPSSSARARSAAPTGCYLRFAEVFERTLLDQRRDEHRSLDETPGPRLAGAVGAAPPGADDAVRRQLDASWPPAGRDAVSGIRGVPPGRAGRTWLSRGCGRARRGATLLDRKLRILRPERERFRRRRRGRDAALGAGPRRRRGVGAAGVAARRQRRAASAVRRRRRARGRQLVGGHGGAVPERGAGRAARRGCGGALPATSAVLCATAAYREALSAAVDAAVALGAARALDEEVAATRFRLRAVQDRWVPRLERAAAALDLALAEAEGAEAVRLRLGAGAGREGGHRPLPRGTAARAGDVACASVSPRPEGRTRGPGATGGPGTPGGPSATAANARNGTLSEAIPGG